MDDERLRVGYVGQQGEDLKTVNEPVCFFLSPVDEDGKDGSSAMRKVALVTSVVRMAGQGRMVDPFHLGMSVKKGCNAQGIGYMALYPKRKCFQSLKQQESIERADGGTCVTQQDGTDAGDIGCMAGCFGEAQAVVTRVGEQSVAGNLPEAFQSNLPESMMMPPSEVPCPPIIW
mgnify:CR=1 FL=1